MDWYKIVRQFFFRLDAEKSHNLGLNLLNKFDKAGLLSLLIKKPVDAPVTVAGITFPNPVGLAAGLDKNGDHIDALASLGFGFIEIGTITPRPQDGNPKPRLFRLPAHGAIINRMGFNNKGVDYLVEQVKKASFNGVLGINIGKNIDTAVEDALSDYMICLEKVYQHATYITVNISSPNTPGLRTLQYGDALRDLLAPLRKRQKELAEEFGYKPIFVKIAPDMDADELKTVAQTLIDCEVDGVIATNTTLSREGVQGSEHAEEMGGLSGEPVEKLSTKTVQELCKLLDGKLPVIGVGGIHNGEGAAEKTQAGAALIQVYSGFIYRGPALITECAKAIS